MATSSLLLVDTNAVSEMSRREPHPMVSKLYAERRNDIFVSVITLGELRRGEVRLRKSDALRASRVSVWIDTLERELADRILPVDAAVAHRWGELTSDRSRPIADALIAATASIHDLVVVTRNVHDFRDLGVSILNPWDA